MSTLSMNNLDTIVDKTEKGVSKKTGLFTATFAALVLQACATQPYPMQELDQYGNPVPLSGETDTEYLVRQNNDQVIVDNRATSVFELRTSAHNLAQLEEESCKINAREANFNIAQESYEDCRDNIAKTPSITTQEQADIRHQICVITANKWLKESNIKSDDSCAIESCKIEASILGEETGGGLFSGGKCEDGNLYN